MFKLPTKEIIVNDDTQVRLLEDDGTVYVAADASPSAGGFILEGFLSLILGSALQLLSTAVRIIKTAASTGAAEVRTYVLTATSSPADAVFRIVYESLDLTPTEFQGRPAEKRYQISAAQTTVDGIGAKIAAVINGDAKAPVTAAYTSGTDTLVLTAKQKGITFKMYSSDITLPTETLTTAAALPINTYDYLKNIEWAKNVDFDRNTNYYPLPGVSYSGYYFEVNGTPQATMGNSPYPSEKHNTVKYGVKIWAKVGSTLETKLDLLVTDMNV